MDSKIINNKLLFLLLIIIHRFSKFKSLKKSQLHYGIQIGFILLLFQENYLFATANLDNLLKNNSSTSITGHSDINNRTFNDVWMSDALHEALTQYTPSSLLNKKENFTGCTKDGLKYKQHLKNLTLWAVQMYESNVHSVGGVITADTFQLGHFDECLNVSYPVNNIKGKYCLTTLKYGPSLSAYKEFYTPSEAYFHDPPSDSIVWEKIKHTLDPRMKPRSILYLGMCVPSSCSYNDVQSSLNFTVNTTFNKYNLYGEIYLNESACFSEGDNKKSSGFYVMVSILLTMLILTITATMYDYFVVPSKHDMANSTVNKLYGNEQNYKTNKLEETFLAFSMKVNVKELVSDGVNSSIDVLNGGKFISLVFIMLGHRTLYSLGSALQNPEYWETSIISKWDMTFMNGTHLVDTFFLIGGFLAFFGVHGQLEKTKKFNLLLLVLFRWIRLMPVYAVVMGVYALLLIHLGSGPIWNIKLGLESENCRETWWLNTLFINNYIQPEKQCVLMSWYLACDMHFFIVSACIIYLLWKSPFYGEIVCGIIFIISLIIPFTITYMGNHDGKLKLYLKLLVNPYVDKEYNSVYIRSHSRSIPYLAGVIIGYISHRMKIAKCTIPKIFIYPGILLFVIAFGIQAYCLVLYIPGRPYSALENAIFSALLPLTWSIGIGWIILVSYTTGFGLFTWLFAQKIYTPLSRLAYCIVLIHPAVQLAQVSSNPTSEYLTYPKMVWMMLGDLTVSLLLSVILYLLVEAPFRTVSKLWLQNGWKRREPPKHSDLEQVPQQQMNGGNNVGLSQIAPGIPVTITNNINNSNYFNKDNIINGNS